MERKRVDGAFAADALQPLTLGRAPRFREAAYASIKEAILAGQFAPGQPLIEEQVAATLHISRTPIREAMALLEHDGLIAPDARHGRGLYVRRVSRAAFEEMFSANETVEPALARRAAQFARDAHLARMQDAIAFGLTCAARQDMPGYLRSGRDFHGAMAAAAQNATLGRFAAQNEEHTDLYLLGTKTQLDIPNLTASLQEHQAILDAIARQDPDAAARLVIYHAQALRQRLAPLFDDDGASAIDGDGA